jgi:hypothetical protein
MAKTRAARAKMTEKRKKVGKGTAKASRAKLATTRKAEKITAKKKATARARTTPPPSGTSPRHVWPGLPPGYFDRAR